MNEVPVSEFEKAIRATHEAASRLIARHRVRETFEGKYRVGR